MISKIINGNEEIVAVDKTQLDYAINLVNANAQALSNKVDHKAEQNDLTSIIATGSTNTTGAQINSGSYFYLNGVFCKALSNIAANASFTKNTNYKETTIAAELIELFNS